MCVRDKAQKKEQKKTQISIYKIFFMQIFAHMIYGIHIQ